jgi:hypothetical protein
MAIGTQSAAETLPIMDQLIMDQEPPPPNAPDHSPIRDPRPDKERPVREPPQEPADDRPRRDPIRRAAMCRGDVEHASILEM